MAIGVYDYIGQLNQGDTAELLAYLRINGQPVTADQIASVSFTVQLPDGTTNSQLVGKVNPDGAGFYRWTNTQELGEYNAQCQFTLVWGEIRSVMVNFSIIDPFNPPAPTNTDVLIEAVMLRLEDCFDSELGGPWLRERTLAHFDAAKIASFIPEALMDINLQMPPTNLDINFFTQDTTEPGDNPNMPLLTKGVLCLTIRHLMRSYTEQWIVNGGQIVQPDRTRYQQAWGAMYAVEYKDYIEAVRLWKRTFLNYGQSALLTFNKAGRLFPYASQRTRGAGRGYY